MIYIADFEDSFTYNIFCELSGLYKSENIKVINLEHFADFLTKLEKSNSKSALILGPGPCAPTKYARFYPLIKKILKKKNIFTMGICLGHQMIWDILGAEILPARKPIHGQSIEYNVPPKLSDAIGIDQSICVQHYNSLAVVLKQKKNGWLYLEKNKEIIISYKQNILTYQFHPESMGTTCPKSFFSCVVEFLI